MYKSRLLILFVSICFFGCGSSMKEFGGNLMTTAGGGSPVGALVGVSLGGLLYGVGSSIEDLDVDQNMTIISSVDTNNSQE